MPLPSLLLPETILGCSGCTSLAELGLLMCVPGEPGPGRNTSRSNTSPRLSVLLTWHAGVPWGVLGGESWAHLLHVSAISPSTMQGRGGAGWRWMEVVPWSSEGEGAFPLRGPLPGNFRILHHVFFPAPIRNKCAVKFIRTSVVQCK